jgi:hypothetical protein
VTDESRVRAASAAALSLDHAVNWEAISAIGQIVGALAVVISLIYLASGIRRFSALLLSMSATMD